MSAQLNLPRTLYGSQMFSSANTSRLLRTSTNGLCNHDEMSDRSEDDHHDELEFRRCPFGEIGDKWLVWDVEDWQGKAESAREMNIFFIHRTISSESLLG